MHGNKELISYPFLYEKQRIVDFELVTDEIASFIAFAVSITDDQEFKKELQKVEELVYHLNACVRTKTTLEAHELAWLYTRYEAYQYVTQDRDSTFVLPGGGQLASILHVCRAKTKQLVRLLHQITEDGIVVSKSLFDFTNILANYFFAAAMYANVLEGIAEQPFISRVYK